jgi:predicted Zn-dependent protease
MTRANATLWGDTRHQARTWAEFNPTSPRAQVSAAQEEINHGEYAAALERLKPMLVRHPEEVQLAFNVLATQCLAGKLEPADIDAAERSIAITKDPGSLIASWFDRIIPVSITNGCPGLDPEALVKIATAGLGNPNLVAGRHQDLEHVIGAIRLAQRRPEEALTHFDNAIAYDAQEPAAMSQAAELGSAGYPSLGLSHLLTYDKLAQVRPPPPIGMGALHAWVLERQHYWAKERARLETTLRADRDANRTRNID